MTKYLDEVLRKIVLCFCTCAFRLEFDFGYVSVLKSIKTYFTNFKNLTSHKYFYRKKKCSNPQSSPQKDASIP